LAKINYSAIPEELGIKEIMVTKGASYKKMRIMGRGRTGIGKIRSTHVTIKVDKVDFKKRIAEAKDRREKVLWKTRKNLAEQLRASPQGGGISLATSTSP
jgi:hypothetical protein